jgi:hypothetical protein
VGIALKSFSASIDEVRHTNQELPYQNGNVINPSALGRMVVEMEGDIMGNTAATYWAKRKELAAAFMSPFPVNPLGYLVLGLPGETEQWAMDASLVSPLQMPIGLAGATITPWRVSIGGDDPWFRGTTSVDQTIAVNTNVNITGLGGNAPMWPNFVITGPITNPTILWQGQTVIIFNSLNLPAGQQIGIYMRDRFTYNITTGSNLFPYVAQMMIWQPIDVRTIPALGRVLRLNGTGTTGATTLRIYGLNSYTI